MKMCFTIKVLLVTFCLILNVTIDKVDAQSVHYDFNEPTDRGFTTENLGDGPNEWARDTVLGIGNEAPDSTYIPPMGWATNPQGLPECAELNSPGNYALVTPQYIATADSIEFDFYEYMVLDDVTSCFYDNAWLEYRINSGSWSQVWQDCSERTPWQINENTVSGFNTGDTVQFRFRFLKNDGFCGGTFHKAGWYIDSLNVYNVNEIPLNFEDTYVFDNITTSVIPGLNNAAMLGVNIELSGYSGVPFGVSDFYFNIGSTDDVNDIDSVTLFFANEEGGFSTVNKYGSASPTSTGNIHISGSDSIKLNNNEYWLAFNVDNNATLSNDLDAEFDSVLVNDTMRYPSVTNLPGTREIVSPLSGIYHVGQGQNYETITDALTDLETIGISGNVDFVLTDAVYDTAETFPLTIHEFNNASNDTVTIRPANSPSVISDTIAVFRIGPGVKNVIIDGSNDGSDSRDMTLKNVSSSSSASLVWIESNGSKGVSNFHLKNSIISGNDHSAENTTGIFAGADASKLERETGANNDRYSESEEGAGHADLFFVNNHIFNVHHGIYAAGTSNSLVDSLSIINNEIGNIDDNLSVGWRGIALTNSEKVVIKNNHIHNLYQNVNESSRGIHFMGEVKSGTISSNEIHNIESGDSYDSGQGIFLSDNAENFDVFNNAIYDLRAGNSFSASEDNNAFGIVVEGNAQNININFNSIVSSTPSIQDANDVGGILLQDNATGITMKNNIFETQIPGNDNFAVFADDLNSTDFIEINYNIYYSSDNIGILNGNTYSDLTSWQGATGDDNNSLNADPEVFDNTNDLRVLLTSPAINAGTDIANIAADIKGNTRSTPDPYIGAYEEHPPDDDIGVSALISPGEFQICGDTANSILVEISNFGVMEQSSFNVSVDVEYQDSVVASSSATYNDTLQVHGKDTIEVGTFDASSGGEFSFKAYTELSGDSDNENDTIHATLQMEEIIDPPHVDDQFFCQDTVNTVFNTTSPADVILWYDSLDAESHIDTGSSFDPGILTETTTFYVKASNMSIFNAGKTNNTSGNGFLSGTSSPVGLEFDATEPLHLESVKIYPDGSGTLDIELWDENNVVLESTSVPVSGGTTAPIRIDINFDIPAETGLQLVLTNGTASGLNDLYRSDLNPGFPFVSANGEIEIVDGVFASRYYYFYDWEVANPGCESAVDSFTAHISSDLNVDYLKGSVFEGSWNEGSQNNPDVVCPNNEVNYEITPPDQFENSHYPNSWEVIDYSVETDSGTTAQNFSYSSPSGNDNAKITFTPQSSEMDSTFIVSASIVQDGDTCTYSAERRIVVESQPQADFNVSDTCHNSVVTFSNETIANTAPDYHWDFGDGDSSSAANPQYTYTSPGNYQVTLTAQYGKTCFSTHSENVEIFTLPDADFEVQDVCDGDSVHFNNLSGGDHLPHSYTWDLGDGDSSTNENPSHVYSSSGIYEASLTVESDVGCKVKYSDTVEVFKLPDVDFQVSDVCDENLVEFNNTTNETDTPYSYTWNLGDGNLSTDIDPSHIYSSSGSYEVSLLAQSAIGCEAKLTDSLEVFEVPEAAFVVDTACAGSPVTFYNHSAPGSLQMTYEWDFGDGSSSTDENPSHIYSDEGTYQVTLVTTTLGGCTDTATSTVDVFESPQANFQGEDICDGSSVTFVNNSSLSSGSLNYEWDFGDGNISADEEPVHTFPDEGNYDVLLVAISDKGCTDSSFRNIDVFNRPTAEFSAEEPCENSEVNFDNHSTGTGTISYSWNFGDGETSNEDLPSHSYDEAGKYEVSLVASTQKGCEDTFKYELTVHQVPVAEFEVDNSCRGSIVNFDNLSSIDQGSLNYKWDLGVNNTLLVDEPEHSYEQEGTYDVTLIASSDEDCFDTITHQIEIYPLPVVSLIKPYAVCPGDSIEFIHDSELPGDTNILTWNFGDGNVSFENSPVHAFSESGDHEVALIAETGEGCVDSSRVFAEVFELPDSDFKLEERPGLPGIFVEAEDTDLDSYEWNLGDGNTVENQTSLEHTYAENGNYQVTLNVSGQQGCVNSTTKTVDITTVGITLLDPQSNEFIKSYPNPFSHTSELVVKLSEKAEIEIELFDANGRQISRIIQKQNVSGGEHSYMINGNMLNLASGSYFVRVTIDGDAHDIQLNYIR